MTQSQGDYSLDNQIGYLLRLANQRHTSIFQAHTLEGLTSTQFATMVRLKEYGPCSQNHLGRLTGMDIATTKGVMDRLKHKGFANSAQHPEDKRRMVITLSPAGEKIVAQMQEIGRSITEETLRPLTSTERRNLIKTLRKIA